MLPCKGNSSVPDLLEGQKIMNGCYMLLNQSHLYICVYSIYMCVCFVYIYTHKVII